MTPVVTPLHPQAVVHHHFTASIGDLIAVAALALAWLLFRLDRAATTRGEIRATTAVLRGLRDHFFIGAGRFYFSSSYTPKVAEERAESARGHIDQVYVIPAEPIQALVADQSAVEAGLVSPGTMSLGTFALWQINKINELVRMQSTFNAVHAPDFLDESQPPARREAVYQASVNVSILLHGGIGTARDDWYTTFEGAVDRDWHALESRRKVSLSRYVRSRLAFGDVTFAAAVVVALAAYLNSL